MYCIFQSWELTATYCSLGSTGICGSNWELLVAKAENQKEAQVDKCHFRHLLANSMRRTQGMDGDLGKTWL